MNMKQHSGRGSISIQARGDVNISGGIETGGVSPINGQYLHAGSGTVVTVSNGGRKVIVNGEEITDSPGPLFGVCEHVVSHGTRLYVNGREYFPKQKKFKVTFRSLWVLVFG